MVSFSLSLALSPRAEFSNGILGGEGGSAEFLKNSRKLVDNGESKEDLRGEIIQGFFFESIYGYLFVFHPTRWKSK